jgi:uncharacterized membrane protein
MSDIEGPAVPPAAGDGLELVLPGRVLAAGAGAAWVREGWVLFTRAPLMWIIAMVLLFALALLMSLVPVLGSLAYQALQAVFAGGLVAACRSLETGGDFDLEHLLAGFQARFVNLFIVGVLLMLGGLAIFLLFAMFAGFSVLTALFAGNPDLALGALMASAGTLILGVLVALALAAPLLAAYWFAPALVMLHDMAPIAAMKASFFAVWRNFLPFLVYGLVMGVALVVAMIPFGLGLLVWAPVAIASTYAAYRGIFTAVPGSAVRPMA